MVIVRQVSSEVIDFWSFASIPKIIEPFELIIDLLSVVTFDADPKDEISDILVSFIEVIFLTLWCMVDSTTSDDLFSKIEMGPLIFSEWSGINPSGQLWNAEALGILLYDFCSWMRNNF